MGWQYYLHARHQRRQDDQYRIVAIVQSTPQAEPLKTVYLAELLHLSVDRSTNLYEFKIKEAEEALLSFPLVKKALIKKILPGTLYIDYQTRVPIACLGDYHNTAIDEEGYLFPFHPFFTPKYLPIIYLGLSEDANDQWGTCLKEREAVRLAFAVLHRLASFKQNHFYVKQLDVSQAGAGSYGQRQMIVTIEKNKPGGASAKPAFIFLRLSPEHYSQALANFYRLYTERRDLFEETQIVDLRLPHLAFIQKRN